MARITNWDKKVDRSAPDASRQVKRTVLVYENTKTGDKAKLWAAANGGSVSYYIKGAPGADTNPTSNYRNRRKAEEDLRDWLRSHPMGVKRR